MSSHSSSANHGESNKPGVKDNIKYAWIIYPVLLVFLTFFVIFLVQPSKTVVKKNNNNEFQSENSTKSVPTQKTTSEKASGDQKVELTSEWTFVSIPSGVDEISFIDANVKYCAKNAVHGECSIETENIAPLFGSEKSTNNLTFWFRKKEGQPDGQIYIHLKY